MQRKGVLYFHKGKKNIFFFKKMRKTQTDEPLALKTE